MVWWTGTSGHVQLAVDHGLQAGRSLGASCRCVFALELLDGKTFGWERVYEQWKQNGVKLVGIGLLAKKEACQAFVQRYHLSFPNGYDGDGNVARLYGFTYQPYWAVIDKDGRLLKAGSGPEGEDELAGTIKRLTGR